MASTRNGDGQLVGVGADSHLPLLHRLQQRALHLGRGAVDLVGQHDIGEHRALARLEIAGFLVVDHRTQQIGGQQVRGKLDTAEPGFDHPGQGAHAERFGQPRHTLDQHVPIAEQAQQQALDHVALADNHAAHLFHHPPTTSLSRLTCSLSTWICSFITLTPFCFRCSLPRAGVHSYINHNDKSKPHTIRRTPRQELDNLLIFTCLRKAFGQIATNPRRT